MKYIKNLVKVIVSLSLIVAMGVLFAPNLKADENKFSLKILFGDNEHREIDKKSDKIVTVDGVKFAIWNVQKDYLPKYNEIQKSNLSEDEKNKEEENLVLSFREQMNKLSMNELDSKFGVHIETNKTTAEESSIKVDNLLEGIYYIRQISGMENAKIDNILIHLPLSEGIKVGDSMEYSIYPKTEIVPKKIVGGKKFVKTDNSQKIKYLSGAKFIVAKKVGNKYENVKNEFGKDLVFVSDKNGEFIVNNLPYGKYYLIETQAPKVDGVKYSVLTEPYPFEINKNSLKDDKAVRIIDKPIKTSGIVIPITGNIQIYIYSILGLSLVLFGGIVYKDSKSKKSKNNN